MIFQGKLKLKLTESLLISAFAVAGMFAFDRFWQKPRSRELKEIQSKIELTKKNIDDTRKVLENLKVRAPASEDQGPSKSLFEKYLSSNDHFSDVIQGIFDGSQENDFAVQKIVSLKSMAFGGYTQTLYELEAESDFISIGRFLEGLEDSPLLTEVESIDISRIENEISRCRASIRLYGYVGGGKP